MTRATFFSPPKTRIQSVVPSFTRAYTYAFLHKLVFCSLYRRCADGTQSVERPFPNFRRSFFFFSTVPLHHVVFSVQMCHALATASSVRMISGCPNCCCKRAALEYEVSRCHYYVNGRRYYCSLRDYGVYDQHMPSSNDLCNITSVCPLFQ